MRHVLELALASALLVSASGSRASDNAGSSPQDSRAIVGDANSAKPAAGSTAVQVSTPRGNGRDNDNNNRDHDKNRGHGHGHGHDNDHGDDPGDSPNPTPEPGTLLLMGLAAGVAGLRARRSRKAR